MAKQDTDLRKDGPNSGAERAVGLPAQQRATMPAAPEPAGAYAVEPPVPALAGPGIPLSWRITLLMSIPAIVSALACYQLARQGADLLTGSAVVLALVALGAWYAIRQARSLLQPIRQITSRADLLAMRHCGEIPVRSRCELAALANSFNAMTTAVLTDAGNSRQMYLAEVQNSLDLQRQYALMQMLRNLASAANDCDSLEHALQNSLAEIGSYLDWPVGRLVLVAGKAGAKPGSARSHWYAPDRERFAAFLEASDDASVEVDGAGLIGRARQSKLTHWISDLGRLDDWPGREAALACGLRTGFVIPIAAEQDVTAFVAFFSDHRIEASAEMLELVEAISVELWSTANRYQSESSLRAADMHAHRLALIAECMEGAIAVTGASGRVEWVNTGLTRLVGFPATQSIGKDVTSLLFGSDPPAAAEFKRQLESGERVTGLVLPAQAKNADTKWYELEIEPMPARGTAAAGSFVIVRDITRERATQMALSDALECANQASQSKSQFLANMSHEIRTPMNGVLGMAELLLGTELDERQRRFIESLYRSGVALLDIINDILDFSKIEAGKLELESIDFDLRTLVEDLVELLAPRAHEKRIELAYKLSAGLPATVRGDPTRLRQVLINIIGNAIKFTERGEVVLTVEALADDPANANVARATRVRFVVRDTGIGMRPEAVERLFSVFMQADQSSSRRYGGTGLGLAICRQLTELMSGSISATSHIGEGSVFQVEMPLQHGDSSAVLPRAPSTGSLAGKRVLVAEDNPTNRRILSEQLRSLDMDCALAENGRQALQMLRIAARSAMPFDVAVVDMKMPIMDGMALAAKVRADAALRDLPLVMLTSITGRDDARRAHAIGVDAYLSKPVRQQDLIASLSAVLELQPLEPIPEPESDRLVGLAGRRVLVVEDNLVNQEVVSAMLAGFGCESRLAEDGLAALSLLEREDFDVVLMDCQMPTMDGFEAMRRLRDPDYQQHDLARARLTPVIALTANALSGDAERCRAAGFSDYLAKPFRQRDLGEVLLRWTATGNRSVVAGKDAKAPSPAANVPALVELPVIVAPAAAPATAADEHDVLELRVLEEIATMERNGARDLLRRLIATYERSSESLVQTADQGFARDDPAMVVQALHTLKSSSANMGALRFSRACNEVEALVRQRLLADAKKRWQALRADYETVLRALNTLRRGPGHGVGSWLAEIER